MQLFTLLMGRIRLPNRVWYRANASVLRVNGQFAGFVIMRHTTQPTSEIYMCALLREFRGKGLGELMIVDAINASVPDGQAVIADCLPASRAMMALLEKIGFVAEPQENQSPVRRFRFVNDRHPMVGAG